MGRPKKNKIESEPTTEMLEDVKVEAAECNETPKSESEPPARNPKIEILEQFADLWQRECKGRSVARIEVGKQIWELFNNYVGRKDRFNGCASCLPPKIQFLKKECQANNINFNER